MVVEVRTFTGGGFAENAYLAVCNTTGVAAAVDPGADSARLANTILSEELDFQAVLLTHAHFDHIEGVSTIRETFPEVPIWLHPEALGMYRSFPDHAARFGIVAESQPEPTDELLHGQRFELGETAFDVRYAPGHAPGHVILVEEDTSVALVGDVVFQGSIGRTDLPGGDFQMLMTSIRNQVLTLPDHTVLYPGHGPPTTVEAERIGNPFLISQYGGELA